MSSQEDNPKATAVTGFGDACALLEEALRGTFRQEVSTNLTTSSNFRTSLSRLRDSMRTNLWKTGSQTLDLGDAVNILDLSLIHI